MWNPSNPSESLMHIPFNDEGRRGDWFETLSGVKYYPYDPRTEDLVFDDIAHGLSMICRWGGQCRVWYSVAQHSVMVSEIVFRETGDKALALEALLHDAPEALMGDMVTPQKKHDPVYQAAEELNLRAVLYKFGLRPGLEMPSNLHPSVHRADGIALVTERRDIKRSTETHGWDPPFQALDAVIVPLAQDAAKSLFERQYAFLTG